MLSLLSDKAVASVALSPDGWHVAAACNDGSVRFWDIALLGADRPLHNWATLANRGALWASLGEWEKARDQFTEAINRGANGWAVPYSRGEGQC